MIPDIPDRVDEKCSEANPLARQKNALAMGNTALMWETQEAVERAPTGKEVAVSG